MLTIYSCYHPGDGQRVERARTQTGQQRLKLLKRCNCALPQQRTGQNYSKVCIFLCNHMLTPYDVLVLGPRWVEAVVSPINQNTPCRFNYIYTLTFPINPTYVYSDRQIPQLACVKIKAWITIFATTWLHINFSHQRIMYIANGQTYIRDKTQWCLRQGFPMLRIFETRISNLEK